VAASSALSAVEARATPAADPPLNGVFESCPPIRGQLCVDRLNAVREMGFDLVINGAALDDGPLAARQYAQAAQQAGLLVAWPLSNEKWWLGYDPTGHELSGAYPWWAASCAADLIQRGVLGAGQGCTNQQLLEHIVTTLAAVPNTWGWYAADDLQLRKGVHARAVKAWTQRLKVLAPQRETLVSVWRKMSRFRNVARFVAQESYPFGLPQQRPSWSDIAHMARRTEELTPGPSSFVLQAFSWGSNIFDAQAVDGCEPTEPPQTCLPKFRYPTRYEQRRQRRTILSHSRPALLLWNTLVDTLGPYEPRDGPNYVDPTPEQSSARVTSLTLAIAALPPRTRACVRLRRRSERWILDARASQALGGVRRIRWRHPGWHRRGHGFRVTLRPSGAPRASSASLVLRDGYGGRAKVNMPLSARKKGGLRCRTSPARLGW
jgi:hypothetical protein